VDGHFKQAGHIVTYPNAFTNLTAKIVCLMFIIYQLFNMAASGKSTGQYVNILETKQF
jgi:hypothetical protein